jgi:DNA-binding XRE family transcriptional regulator
MEKKQFIKLLDEKLKLIRTEYGLSQDKMAAILGISKKTLIEIEKNRKSLGWTNSVALASIFSDSTILRDAIEEILPVSSMLWHSEILMLTIQKLGRKSLVEDNNRKERLPHSAEYVFHGIIAY